MNWDKIGVGIGIFLMFSVFIPLFFWLFFSFVMWQILPFSWTVFRLFIFIGGVIAFHFWFSTDEEGNVK